MRRNLLSAIVVLLLVVVAAPPSYSLPPGGYGYELLNNYYSDDSFSSGVGWDDRDCSGLSGSGGTMTNWRYHEVFTCDGVETSSDCQEYQPGVGWVNVSCPDYGATAQARVHITVG